MNKARPLEITQKGSHIYITSTMNKSHVLSVINLDNIGHSTICTEEVDGVKNLFLKTDGQTTNVGPVPEDFKATPFAKTNIKKGLIVKAACFVLLGVTSGFLVNQFMPSSGQQNTHSTAAWAEPNPAPVSGSSYSENSVSTAYSKAQNSQSENVPTAEEWLNR